MRHIFCVLNNSKSSIEESRGGPLKVIDQDIVSYSDLSKIEGNDIFIADGGINFLDQDFLRKNKIFWIGDRDSIDDDFLLDDVCFYKEELNQDKDFSDFARVLDYILEGNEEDVFMEVYNALGGESSHEYSNILEIRYFLERLKLNSKTATVFIKPSIVITNRKISLMLEKNRMFSIISLEDKSSTFIKVEGSKYQGDIELIRPSLGTRNVSISNIVEVDPKNNKIMIIID